MILQSYDAGEYPLTAECKVLCCRIDRAHFMDFTGVDGRLAEQRGREDIDGQWAQATEIYEPRQPGGPDDPDIQ